MPEPDAPDLQTLPIEPARHGPARHEPARAHPPAGARAPSGLGLRAATLAAAAAVGAMIGFGLSDGASLGRLGVVTLRLRGLPEFVAADRRAVGAAFVGGVHVAVVSGLWGAAGAAVDRWLGRRGLTPPLRGAVLGVLAAVLAFADVLLPRPLRLAAGALGNGERVLVALLVAAAAWAAARDASARDARVRDRASRDDAPGGPAYPPPM